MRDETFKVVDCGSVFSRGFFPDRSEVAFEERSKDGDLLPFVKMNGNAWFAAENYSAMHPENDIGLLHYVAGVFQTGMRFLGGVSKEEVHNNYYVLEGGLE